MIKNAIDFVEVSGSDEGPIFRVGYHGVTKITEETKPGLHCDIPYIYVWIDDHVVAEYCQHNIAGITRFPPNANPV